MKAVVAAFNQEKALVGAFFVITNLRMELFQALIIWPFYLDIKVDDQTQHADIVSIQICLGMTPTSTILYIVRQIPASIRNDNEVQSACSRSLFVHVRTGD